MDRNQCQGQLLGQLVDCLVELTYFYERRMTKEALLSGLPLKDGELTVDLFQRAAERADFSSKHTVLAYEDINEGILPCILLTKNNNHIILFEIIEDEAEIFEDNERKSISLEQLEEEYGGSVILVKPKEDTIDDKKAKATFNVKEITWFWSVIRKNWSSYAEVLLASFFINLFALAAPLFMMNVYNRVVPNNALETLWALAIGIFIIYLFDFIIKLLRTQFVDNAAHKIDTQISAKIFEHIMGVRMGKRPKFVGQILNNFQGFEGFRDFMTSLTITVIIDFPFIILFLLVVWFIGGKLALIPFCLIPIALVVSFLIQSPLIKIVQKNYEVSAEKQRTLVESLIGISTVKTQNAEGVTQRRWERLVSYAAKLNVRLKFLTNIAVNFSTFLQYMGTVLVVIGGVYMISNNNLTIGALIACSILTGRILAPISQVVSLVLRYYQSITSIKALDDMMNLPVERPIGKKFLNPEKIEERIDFINVSFQYEGATTKAIDSINIRINPKERIAILGKVGAGKSTMLKLLLGLYEASKGKINFSGSDIKRIDPMLVRKYIGYVPQDPMLFNGTIRDNIVLGDPNASDDDILTCVEQSGLESFITEHIDGINTQVGEQGSGLSGGQRQAVAIAQALLHNPPLLIFDEPTTSFDEFHERKFKEKLRGVLDDKTLIISTHKVSMLDLVDRIIILDRGRVVADGPKEDVLQALRDKKITVSQPDAGK